MRRTNLLALLVFGLGASGRTAATAGNSILRAAARLKLKPTTRFSASAAPVGIQRPAASELIAAHGVGGQ
jgi:hypothetical protein